MSNGPHGDEADRDVQALRLRTAELEQQLADCYTALGAAGHSPRMLSMHDADEYLQTVIATSHDGILVVDSVGRFEFGNEAFFRIFGWPEDELIGHHFIKVVPEDLHEFILERWVEVQAGKGAPYEVDIVHKDGTRRNLLVSHRHMTIAGQRKYCVITKDVTELKRAQEGLELLGLIAEQVADSVITTNPDYEITYANRSFHRIYGYHPRSILGRSPDFLNAEPDAERIQNEIYQAVSMGQSWRGEILNRRKDGSVFPCELTVFPLVSAHGKTLAFAGIQRDLTEPKRAEEALRQSERKFRAIFDQTFEMIGLLRCDGTVLEANNTAMDFGRLDESDVVGKPFWETPWWAHSQELRDRLRDAIDQAAAGQFARFEAFHPGSDGQTRYVDVSIKPVEDEEGNVVLLIPEGRDITERKAAEDELARHRDHLEEIVEKRTRQVVEAQAALRKAHSRLLNVSEAERRHLARELHDSVGQNLAAITVGIRLAVEACRDAAGHEEELTVLNAAVEQCAETMREVRAICHGLYPPALESMGLASAIRQLGRSCGSAIQFHLDCPETLARARFAPEQEIALFRIAQEAVSNVLKHSRATRIRVALGLEDSQLTMTVIDDGVGFDATTVAARGLGLRSMDERARAIGGTTVISSEPGRTTIDVSTPAQPAGPDQD